MKAATFDYCSLDEAGHCITCADEALPARVIAVEQNLAVVNLKGQTTEVDISLVEEVTVGQLVLVHGGVALACLSEA